MSKKKRRIYKPSPRINIGFKRKNYLILLGAILCIILGFVSLAHGSITLAPILLVVGYVILLPLAILLR